MAQTTSTRYGIVRELPDVTMEKARERVTEALANEGFGILTEIDVQATVRKKLDKDFVPYLILGACNPQLAHQALLAEPQIGLLLPCNVVLTLRETGTVVVSAMDPGVMSQMTDNPALEPIAVEARQRLTRALERM